MRFQMKHPLATLFKAAIVIPMVMMMFNFAGSPVEGQGPPGGSMAQYYGSSNNRNNWVNEDGTVYGEGSTQPYANPYNHQGRVIVTVTSQATGRSVSFDTGFVGSSAFGRISLPFDETDRGPFETCTDHKNFCPVSGIQFAPSFGCLAPFTFSIPLRWIEARVTDTIKSPLVLGSATLNLDSDKCTGTEFALIVKFRLIDLTDCCFDDRSFVRLSTSGSAYILQRYQFNVFPDPKDRDAEIFLKRTTGTNETVFIGVSGFYPSGEVASRTANVTLHCP